jgi:hypothetical protein
MKNILSDTSMFPVASDPQKDTIEFIKINPNAIGQYNHLFQSEQKSSIDPNLPKVKFKISDLVLANRDHLSNPPIIFHHAFCGSTYVAKALRKQFYVVPLMEPNGYIGINNNPINNDLVELLNVLYSRKISFFHQNLLKLSDLTSNLIGIKPFSRCKSVFIYIPLEEFLYLATKKERHVWLKGRMLSSEIKEFINSHNIKINDDIFMMATCWWAWQISNYLNQEDNIRAGNLRALNFSNIRTNNNLIYSTGKHLGLIKRALPLQFIGKNDFDFHAKTPDMAFNFELRERQINNLRQAFEKKGIHATNYLSHASNLLDISVTKPSLIGEII